MNESTTPLHDKIYLISDELHEALEKGTLNKCIDRRSKGLYLIKLNKIEKNKILYSYIYYNELFKDSLLYYIYTRLVQKNLFKSEINKNLFLIDNNIKYNLANVVKDIDGINFNTNLGILYLTIKELMNNKDLKRLNYIIHNINYYTEYSNIIEIIINGIKSDYYLILDIILENMMNIKNSNTIIPGTKIIYEDIGVSNVEIDEYNKQVDNKKLYNTINNCVILCEDINDFIKSIEKRGYNISQGTSSSRGEVNEMNNDLLHIDIDYINTLYYHHRYHCNNNRYYSIPNIPRKKFTFKNIHKNLGTVRYYSTTKAYNNRQRLFQENYNNLTTIINNNSNLSKENLQKKIELFLYNQETNYFLGLNKLNKLSYDNKSYKFLINKREDLIKFFNKDSIKQIKSKDFVKNYIPVYIDVIGVELLCDMLIGFFLNILQKESLTTEDGETPGIPSTVGFENFGNLLVNKYIYMLYIKSKSEESLSIFKKLNENEFDVFKEDTFNARIGGEFVHSLIEFKLLDHKLDKKIKNSKETEFYLRINDDVKPILMLDKEKYFHLPQKLPMICEPKDYNYSEDIKKNKLGGYLLNDSYYTNEIFKNKRGYEESTKLSKDNIIVSLINGMSKVPYKINIDTLNFINQYAFEKNILTDDNSEKFKKFLNEPYNGLNIHDRNKYRSLQSKMILEKNILNIAEVYSMMDKIYFPLRLDQRTRIYCETDFFDYQKVDLAKGLILFSKPGYISRTDTTVIKYYKSYGANMYGNGLDKKSINLKCKWIDDNTEKILNFRTSAIVNESENKSCFISFCFEYEKFIKFTTDPERVVFSTYLPIQLDASCNGYQHLALLTKETKLFDKLNLSESSNDDSPDDFYKYIVEKTNEYIKQEKTKISNIPEQNRSEKELKTLISLSLLEKISFDRSIVKKTIMTKSYNAGIPKQVDNIIKNLDEKFDNDKKKYYIYKDENLHIKRVDILTFVMCLKNVLDIESPKIKELSKYLDCVVKICTELQLPVPWNLPTGAMIKESYQKQEELSVKAFSFVRSRYTFKRFIKGTLDLRKQKRATMPNLIHSLDASTIALLYKEFKKYGSLYTVHDCFATTVDNVPYLIDVLKSVYLDLYSSEDYLTQFDQLVKLNINKQYGNNVLNLNDSTVHIPNGSKIKTIQFPDINKVLNIKTSDLNKVQQLVKSSYTLI